METTTKNLHQRLLAIQAGIGRVRRDGVNNFHKYKYVTEGAILSKLKALCVQHGVMITQSVTDCVRADEWLNNKGERQTIWAVTVEYKLTNQDNPEDHLFCRAVGHGQDSGDKAVYKAITGANKYFLLKTFQIPTGDDPERETPRERTEGKVQTIVNNVNRGK